MGAEEHYHPHHVFCSFERKKKKTGNHSRPFLVIGLALDISRSCLGFQFQHHHVCAVVNSADIEVVVIVIIVYREHRSQITKKIQLLLLLSFFQGAVLSILSLGICILKRRT